MKKLVYHLSNKNSVQIDSKSSFFVGWSSPKKYGANRLVFDPLLVGGIPTNPSEKYEFVSWDDEIPNCFWKVIKFHSSKPPTR